MSSFYCEWCNTAIIDSGPRYTTSCKHYPNKHMTTSQYETHKDWLRTQKTLKEQCEPTQPKDSR